MTGSEANSWIIERYRNQMGLRTALTYDWPPDGYRPAVHGVTSTRLALVGWKSLLYQGMHTYASLPLSGRWKEVGR